MTHGVYNFEVKTISGEFQSLDHYRGQVLVIVNVASKCGFTPQYTGLQALYEKHRERGLTILGFPCNQFLAQEPGDEKEIQTFCSTTYDVSFPLFSKIEVNGQGTHPLFNHLKAAAPGALGSQSIKWNFTKFLIDREGKVLKRYAPSTTPEEMEKDIEALL
ncbi:MAG: glutathione peroxidase [Pseudomonadota bacterium]